MQQSKVITLFRNFTEQEWKHFGAFVLSPYHNSKEKLARFYKLLEPHHPLFDSPKLQKEKLYKALHGNKPYNDPTMRELISELFKLARAFVAHEQLNSKGLEASVLRFEWLFERHNQKLAGAELETRSALLADYLRHDRTYYRHQRLYDQHRFEMTAARFFGAEHVILGDWDIYEHIHSMNRDYLVNALFHHIYILSIPNLYKFSPDEDLLNRFEAFAKPYVQKGDVIIDVLYGVFQLLRTGQEEYFFEIKTSLFKNHSVIPPATVKEAGVILSNYCARRIRGGENRFAAEVMDIYRFEVDNNFHINNGQISHLYYFNVTVRGIETADLDWLEQFIEGNKKYLHEEFKEDAYNFSKAHLLFARKKYKEALMHALWCNVSVFIVKILIRNLVARIHYELDMLDELDVELNAHRHHLKDEKITEERRQYLQTFITVMRQLGELKRSYNREKLMALSNQVDTEKGFANRRWFQEKIMELKVAHKRG